MNVMMQRIVRAALSATVLCAIGLPFIGNGAAQEAVKKNVKYPQQVLIIRHAEKTGEDADIHLSKQGQRRAENLFKLFVVAKDRPDPFPVPDFLFAASNAKNSHRPVETITPYAGKRMLSINEMFTSKLPAATSNKETANKTSEAKGMLELRDEIFGNPKYFGKTILIAWRHSTICDLAKTLKASKVPEKWKERVFDRVWQIAYDHRGNASFVDRPQRLLPGDAEK